jgi:hypothetical protein
LLIAISDAPDISFSFFIPEVDLDLVDLPGDLPHTRVHVIVEQLEILPVVRFVEVDVLLQVGNFHVHFGDPDLEVDPHGDDPNQESADADKLR